jgi:hypothetical protein
MDAVAARFVEQSPVTVMARLALQQTLEPAWINALFEQQRQQQYARQRLFSTTVELISVLAAGMRPSVYAAAKVCKDLPVSVQTVTTQSNHVFMSIAAVFKMECIENAASFEPLRVARQSVDDGNSVSL